MQMTDGRAHGLIRELVVMLIEGDYKTWEFFS